MGPLALKRTATGTVIQHPEGPAGNGLPEDTQREAQTAAIQAGILDRSCFWGAIPKQLLSPPCLEGQTKEWEQMSGYDLVTMVHYVRALGSKYNDLWRDRRRRGNANEDPNGAGLPVLRAWLAEVYGAPGLPPSGLPRAGEH